MQHSASSDVSLWQAIALALWHNQTHVGTISAQGHLKYACTKLSRPPRDASQHHHKPLQNMDVLLRCSAAQRSFAPTCMLTRLHMMLAARRGHALEMQRRAAPGPTFMPMKLHMKSMARCASWWAASNTPLSQSTERCRMSSSAASGESSSHLHRGWPKCHWGLTRTGRDLTGFWSKI